MKLSIAWIFDHLDADWMSLDSAQLVAHFNRTTAEIEHTYPITIDVSALSLARVVGADSQKVELQSADTDKKCVLQVRPGVSVGQWYFIKKRQNDYAWATSLDLGGHKELSLPAFYIGDPSYAQTWRTQLEMRDVIIEIDNKSITNRPDLWGHRGIAREIGAMFGIPLKPLDEFVADTPITQEFESADINGFTIANNAQHACKRFAALYIPSIERRPSLLWMAHRLVRIDAKPIDLLVDTTNYVMFDLSQPMHAFDTQTIARKKLMPIFAQAGQKLTLLDGNTIELTHEDLIISDGEKTLALAGVMGGQATAINDTTTSVIIESACFDAGVIRKTAARHKKRTDASARFEKSLDPNQNTQAIQRFIQLMLDAGVVMHGMSDIASIGSEVCNGEIKISHDFIEQRLGIHIDRLFVDQALTSLGFGVQEEATGHYVIRVPTFRATKDITIPEDIVEEIGRMWGYDRITLTLPTQQVKPSDLRPLQRLRTLKQLLASTCSMHELASYPFFDEEFLRIIKWEPKDTVSIQNPVSENWRRLVTTLIPTMCAAVHENYATHNVLRFFQASRAWHMVEGTIHERKVVAGIFFDKKKPVDFYTIKQELAPLFAALDVTLVWHSGDETVMPWYLPHQTAILEREGKLLGHLGVANPLFFNNVAEGHACLFEFDTDVLTHYIPPIKRYTPSSKYPAAERDVSILIPLRYTVAEVMKVIEHAHTYVSHVSLVDFFEKPEWHDYRSLTFHFVVQSHDKTLTKDEVDMVCSTVFELLKNNFNARIR